jgi:hypothetical protein
MSKFSAKKDGLNNLLIYKELKLKNINANGSKFKKNGFTNEKMDFVNKL